MPLDFLGKVVMAKSARGRTRSEQKSLNKFFNAPTEGNRKFEIITPNGADHAPLRAKHSCHSTSVSISIGPGKKLRMLKSNFSCQVCHPCWRPDLPTSEMALSPGLRILKSHIGAFASPFQGTRIAEFFVKPLTDPGLGDPTVGSNFSDRVAVHWFLLCSGPVVISNLWFSTNLFSRVRSVTHAFGPTSLHIVSTAFTGQLYRRRCPR